MWRKIVSVVAVLAFVSAAVAAVPNADVSKLSRPKLSKFKSQTKVAKVEIKKVEKVNKVEHAIARNDVHPGNTAYKPANLGGKENLGDSLWAFDAGTPANETQCLGVEFDGTYFWVTGANSGSDPNKLYKFDANGNLLETYDQPSHATEWGLRDLAWDGQYLYGSASNIISIIDPATGQEVGTFTGPESPNRALAYDPATDHFWTANFSSSIYEFDRNGNVINSYSNSYSIYGAAWDNASPDGPWLWIAAQEDNGAGGYNYIYQFDPRTGTYTGIGFPVVYSSPGGYAGGLAFTTEWDPSVGVLFELVQGEPDVVLGMFVTSYGDPGDPLPPSDVTAYSDYTMPTEINLSWVDPAHYVGGDTLTDFHIEIWMSSETKDTVFLDSVAAGVQQYTATGLTDGTLCTFYLRTVDINDSTSSFASVSWYAGGSPYPAPPHDLTATALDDSTVELTWINPSTQSDGTPLDDLAGINIYVDGELAETYATSDTGALITYDIIVTPGRRTFYVTAVDNESPQHESDPSNEVEVVTNAHTGGPDGYGYTFIDSDHPNGPAFEWIDASVGTPYNLGDDDNVLIQLPFPFPFYDQTLTEIYIVSNGFLTSSNTTDFGNDPLPDNSKNNIIAPFWDDLNPSNGGTIYTYLDTINNIFVVEWYQVPHFGSGGPYTFEVIFYPNGDLKFQYLSMVDRLGESTIGIQGGDGSNDFYLQYTYDGDPLTVHDSLAIMWTYPSYEHDVGIFAVQEPVAGNYTVGDEITPQVTVVNNGQSAESFDVTAVIYYGDSLVYTSTTAVNNLNAGETADLTFADPFTVPGEGTYNFMVYTSLPGDEYPNNDTAEVQFFVLGYTEDFEANDGLYMPDPATGAWEWGTPTYGPPTAHSGTNLWGTVLGGDYENNADWRLYSVDYIATSDNPTITFWQWYEIENRYDGGNVAVSTDNGATWTIVEPVGGYDNNSIVGLGGEPGFTGNSGDWVQAVFNLDGITAGTLFKIRFRFGSDASVTRAGWYIDDVAGAGLTPYLPDHDVSAIDIEAPYGPIYAGSEIVPIGTVRNLGANTETFDVVMTIDSLGKTIVYADTQSVTLEPRAQTVVFFDPWTPQGNPNDMFNVNLRTLLPGDERPDNDEYNTVAWIPEIIEIPATNTPPVLDGVIDTASGEWADALIIDVGDTLGMSPPAQPAGANMMYIMHDRDYVYFAFDITTDDNLTDYDQIGLYIDDNGDNEWAADGSEGNNNILPAANIGWASRVITPGPTFGDWVYPRSDRADCYAISTASGHVVYEIRLPYGTETTPDPAFLGISEDGIFGVWIMYAEENSGEHHIWWPQGITEDEVFNPMFYQKMTLEPMSVAEDDAPKPLIYSLNIKQNPIYKSGVLSFTLPKASDVDITLYDATGRMVSKLASGKFSAGSHTVTLNASKLANGVYFVHMKADNFNTVKKVTVIR